MARSFETLTEQIRGALQRRSRLVAEPRGLVPAAVLLPLLDRPQGVHVLFTKRSDDVPHHKGQISFPGGTVDDGDDSRLHTALREVREEIGLERDAVEILGALDDLEASTGFVITPFVGVVRTSVRLVPDGNEIERVFELPLSGLLDPGNFRTEDWEQNGRSRRISVFECEGEVVWGITARILRQFLDLVFDEERRA
jgi:8-oxo-dGTP pyrophosphatase MutT (NUDIX family)